MAANPPVATKFPAAALGVVEAVELEVPLAAETAVRDPVSSVSDGSVDSASSLLVVDVLVLVTVAPVESVPVEMTVVKLAVLVTDLVTLASLVPEADGVWVGPV